MTGSSNELMRFEEKNQREIKSGFDGTPLLSGPQASTLVLNE